MTKARTRTKTVPGVNAPAAAEPVNYSAQNVSQEICAAAGLRNGMTPEAIHEAIARVIAARS